MKRKGTFCRIVVLLVAVLCLFTACQPPKPDKEEDKPAIVTVSDWKILTGTPYETSVYKFTTDKQGPKVFLMGGTHGDELAGWKAGLKLVSHLPQLKNIRGEIILIPQANILADQLEMRYPGSKTGGVYNGVTYKDLNRNFPGKENGTPTEKIAAALTAVVTAFQPDYIVDLHESLHSWSTSNSRNLGDTLIYGNSASALFVVDLVDEYNRNYKPQEDCSFAYNDSPPKNSFNNYCSTTFPNSVVFTIETNRELALEKRVSQQIGILTALFDTIWQ